MLARLAFAQKHHTNRRHQDENADNLKWQIVVPKQSRTDISDIVDGGSRQRWKRGVRDLEVADYGENLP
jgi:hypothetical protein